MRSTQVLCSILIFTSCVAVHGYGMGGFGGMSNGGQGNFAPKPYGFGYEAPGMMGSHFRKEQGDGSGNVQGSYGYKDSQGLFRQVDYVANAGGFHANVKTNEPGTDGKENPADVNMMAQPAPAGIQDKFSKPSYGGGAGFGGMGGGMNMGGGFGSSPFAGIPLSSHGKSG